MPCLREDVRAYLSNPKVKDLILCELIVIDKIKLELNMPDLIFINYTILYYVIIPIYRVHLYCKIINSIRA